jgi:hypothetical protein
MSCEALAALRDSAERIWKYFEQQAVTIGQKTYETAHKYRNHKIADGCCQYEYLMAIFVND